MYVKKQNKKKTIFSRETSEAYGILNIQTLNRRWKLYQPQEKGSQKKKIEAYLQKIVHDPLRQLNYTEKNLCTKIELNFFFAFN